MGVLWYKAVVVCNLWMLAGTVAYRLVWCILEWVLVVGGGQLGDASWLLGVQGGLTHAVVGPGDGWGQLGDTGGHCGVQGGLKHAEVVV